MAPESKASLSSVRLAWLCLVRVGVGGGLQQNSLGPESNYRRTTLQKSGVTHFLGPHQQTMAAPKVNPGRPGKEQPPGSRALQPGFQGTQQVPMFQRTPQSLIWSVLPRQSIAKSDGFMVKVI